MLKNMETPAPLKHLEASFDFISEDLLQNILARLPAISFASAACVSPSWNLVCGRILCRPKLSTAISLKPSLQVAVEEVVNRVLSEPIRPHFAILYVGPHFDPLQAHQLITGKLGSKTPVITSVPAGIIGRDAVSNEFQENLWEGPWDADADRDRDEDNNPYPNISISLIVGFMPGLKVNTIPLLMFKQVPMIDKFVMDIREYTATVSGCTSPAAIIMFGDYGSSMMPVLEKMDYAMSSETVIVGDASCWFLYRDNFAKSITTGNNFTSAAVALVFAQDSDRHHGIGEIHFKVTFSSGLSPTGRNYKAASVEVEGEQGVVYGTRLSARQEGLDDEVILSEVYAELEDRSEFSSYIGVTKRRGCYIELDKVGWITSMFFHKIAGHKEKYIYVDDAGITTGDSFRFYLSDSSGACRKVCDDYIKDNAKREVFGGIIFSSWERGESCFSLPFLDNFPGEVPVAGSFCNDGEIGRGNMSWYSQDPQVRCCLHAHSTVYLLLSYSPPQN